MLIRLGKTWLRLEDSNNVFKTIMGEKVSRLCETAELQEQRKVANTVQ